MTRLAVPDRSVAGLDVDGRRFRARGGFVDVPDHLVGRMKKAAECFELAQPVRAAGFVCEDCGFHALFTICGRCGGRCNRPGGPDAATQEP